jgi:hypothetical protein
VYGTDREPEYLGPGVVMDGDTFQANRGQDNDPRRTPVLAAYFASFTISAE